MDAIVDIYLPDLKVWTSEHARRYLRMPGYPQVARAAVTEMSRQVGVLRFGEDGLARRGLLVRHLVMPGLLAGTQQILRFVAAELGRGTYVNLMAQYRLWVPKTCATWPDAPLTAGCSAPRLPCRGMIFGLWA